MCRTQAPETVEADGEQTPLVKKKTDQECYCHLKKLKKLTIRSDEDRYFTIPIPKGYEAEVGSVAVTLIPPPEDTDTAAMEEELRLRSKGPENPLVILFTVIAVMMIVSYIIWALFQKFGL